jgi:hypothetical protein
MQPVFASAGKFFAGKGCCRTEFTEAGNYGRINRAERRKRSVATITSAVATGSPIVTAYPTRSSAVTANPSAVTTDPSAIPTG